MVKAPAMRRRRATPDVKGVRRAFGFTQVKFASLLRVKVSTLVAWEIGRQQPSGPYRSLLELIAADPERMVGLLLRGRPHLRPTRVPVPLGEKVLDINLVMDYALPHGRSRSVSGSPTQHP